MGFLRWLFTPQKSPLPSQQKSQKSKKKRQHQQRSSAKSSINITQENKDQPLNSQELGYIDKNGNVRLRHNNRILGKTKRNSKRAALDEYTCKYQERLRTILAAHDQVKKSGLNDVCIQEFQTLQLQVKNDPGLGDIEKLEAALTNLAQEISAQTENLITKRRALFTQLKILYKEQKDDRSTLEALKEQMNALPTTTHAEDVDLKLKFSRLITEIDNDNHTSNLEALHQEASTLLAQLENCIKQDEWEKGHKLIANKHHKWSHYQDNLDNEIFERLEAIKNCILTRHQHKIIEKTQKKVLADTQRAALIARLEELYTTRGTHENEQDISKIKNQWQSLHQNEAIPNPAQELAYSQILAKLYDFLAEQKDQQHKEKYYTQKQRKKLLTQFDQLLEEAANHNTGYKAREKEISDLRNAWSILPEPSMQERTQMQQRLAKLNNIRQAWSTQQDKNRDIAIAKKRALIDGLPKYPNSIKAAGLLVHLKNSMAAWKEAGYAGNAQEEALWQQYQDMRGAIYQQLNELRKHEAEDNIIALCGTFIRKKEQLRNLENLLMACEILAEDKSQNPKEIQNLAKQIKSKKDSIEHLYKELMTLQKRLRHQRELVLKKEGRKM